MRRSPEALGGSEAQRLRRPGAMDDRWGSCVCLGIGLENETLTSAQRLSGSDDRNVKYVYSELRYTV